VGPAWGPHIDDFRLFELAIDIEDVMTLQELLASIGNLACSLKRDAIFLPVPFCTIDVLPFR